MVRLFIEDGDVRVASLCQVQGRTQAEDTSADDDDGILFPCEGFRHVDAISVGEGIVSIIVLVRGKYGGRLG